MKNFFNSIKLDNNLAQRLCMVFAFLYLILVNQEAFANNTDAITQVLCNVIQQLQGGIGKGIATIAIVVLGIGLFLGKLSWPLAVATAIGIGLIFGAAGIVGWISSGTGNNGIASSC
jgi:type IV secretory pathway VirB2 component (pilin)